MIETEITCETYHLVETKRLLALADVLKSPPWGLICPPETFLNKVAEFIKAGDLLSEPVDGKNPNRADLINDHARRCAYFATQPDYEPVHIDVGIPGICHPAWILDDGNHRLYGRAVAGDKHIKAEISGSVDYAKELLGVSL